MCYIKVAPLLSNCKQPKVTLCLKVTPDVIHDTVVQCCFLRFYCIAKPLPADGFIASYCIHCHTTKPHRSPCCANIITVQSNLVAVYGLELCKKKTNELAIYFPPDKSRNTSVVNSPSIVHV